MNYDAECLLGNKGDQAFHHEFHYFDQLRGKKIKLYELAKCQ